MGSQLICLAAIGAALLLVSQVACQIPSAGASSNLIGSAGQNLFPWQSLWYPNVPAGTQTLPAGGGGVPIGGSTVAPGGSTPAPTAAPGTPGGPSDPSP